MTRSMSCGAAAAWLVAMAAAASADPIPVHNTGVGVDGRVLSPGKADPHYTLLQVPGIATLSAGTAPATVAYAHPAYLRNDPVGSSGSSWIVTGPDTWAFHPVGAYGYRTTFDLTGFDPASARIAGAVGADDVLEDVLLNGVSLRVTGGGFTGLLTSFEAASGFREGENTLDFVVRNLGSAPNPTGFRVVLSGTADLAATDVEPPVISGCADRSFEYEGTSIALTPAALGISATDDVDGAVPVTLSHTSVGLGSHSVTASATDSSGNAATCTFTVRVADTTAPSFTSLRATPDTLDVVNHKLVEVTVLPAVEDRGDSAPRVRIVGVACNEDVDAPGPKQGDPDFRITGDLTVELRAERSGKGSGRVYTISVAATDASGNTTTAEVTVLVPHDQGKGQGKSK